MNDVPEKGRLHKGSSVFLCALWFATLSPSALLPQDSDPKKLQSEAVPESSTQDRTPRKTFTALILYHVWDNDRQAFGGATPQAGEGMLFIQAVRSDGAFVKGNVTNTPEGGIVLHRSITDPVARRVTYVGMNAGVREINSRPLGSKLARANLAHSSVCTNDAKAEWSTLLGYGVVHIHRVLDPEHESVLADYWLAPALDCFTLKRTYHFRPGRIAVHEAVFVVEGEPNPALFQIPAGKPETDPALPVVKELEEAYEKSTQAAHENRP